MERVTRAKAIRLKCLDCCCGQQAEVKHCICTDCPLHRYRMGHEDREQYNDAPEPRTRKNGSMLNKKEAIQ